MPGTEVGAGQVALPAGLEAAAVEQVAFWYQNEAHVGMLRIEGDSGSYTELADKVLVPWVREVLKRYRRFGV